MLLTRAWLKAFGTTGARRGTTDRRAESLIEQYGRGRSFADIGTMWHVHGDRAFLAEDLGASAVTAFDAMEPTEAFRSKAQERGSAVRFVRGDLHAA